MKKLLFCALVLLSCCALAPGLLFAGEFKEPEMVLVPKGSFEIGNAEYKNAKPVHKVILSNDFYMGKYEVTNQQYADMLNFALEKGYLDREAMSETAKRKEIRNISKKPQKFQDLGDEDSDIVYKDGIFKPGQGKENLPVIEVTWYGAAFYCNMLSEKEGLIPLYNLDNWNCQVYGKSGYRLPTEAEWEYAAKYDDNRKYAWGNEEPDDTYANIKKDQALASPAPVGTYSPKGDTKLGLADITGNVAEWCNDWYSISYSEKPYETDPVGPSAGLMVYAPPMKKYLSAKVVRGGCFLNDPDFRAGMGIPFLVDCVTRPESATNSGRSYDFVNMSRNFEGFRVVRIGKKEEAGTKGKKPLSEMKRRMSEGVKYVPDKTHSQLTQDDTVYNHYVYERDSQGRALKNKCYNVGPDNAVVISDEFLKSYLDYEYDSEGRLIKEVFYSGKGPDNKWCTADDVQGYYSVYEYDSNGNALKIVRYALTGTVLQYTAFETNAQGLIAVDVIYKDKGADGNWFSADDTIEKYHRFWYDDKGTLTRIAEYHSQHDGRGQDGVWFTGDDVISATKVLSYDKDGSLARIDKCIGPGQDNVWFSDDDTVQYYTTYK